MNEVLTSQKPCFSRTQINNVTNFAAPESFEVLNFWGGSSYNNWGLSCKCKTTKGNILINSELKKKLAKRKLLLRALTTRKEKNKKEDLQT
uniref:Uncharacterized protein n=1 Tax=Romanomermis culicivorax TaxID=13658 RepID=A0A915INZ4_ROMCU